MRCAGLGGDPASGLGCSRSRRTGEACVGRCGSGPAASEHGRLLVAQGAGGRRITGKAHDLRHFASGLIVAGCDVVTVQRALGHAKAATLNTYVHL